MATRMQQRRGTAAQWISTNSGNGPVLNPGEIGFETDTGKFKIGDGVSEWTSLSYFADVDTLGSALDGDFVELSDIGAVSGVAGLDANKNLIVPGASVIIEGTTPDSYEMTITATDPTADRTITLPDSTGTLALTSDIPSLTGYVTETGSQTLTNKSINLANNTVSGTVAEFNTALSDANFITSTDTGTVTSTLIANETIVDGDISNTAAIALSKLATDPLARANHTGTQTASTISDFDEAAQDAVGGILGSGLTYTDASNTITIDSSVVQLRVSGVTDTEIGYLDGVTSNVQSQIDAKAALAGAAFTGNVSTTGNLTVDGNFTVNGSNVLVSATQIQIEDSILQLAHENAGNTVDLGLVAGYNDGTAKHAGLVKDATDGKWKLFDGVTDEPSTTVNFAQASYDDLVVGGLEATSLSVGTVSNTEIGYLDGVTSNVQSQLDAKAPINNASFTGTFSAPSGTITSTMLADETIVNADISNTAAIAQSKIENLTTDLASKASLIGSETLTNKTISLANNTVTGTVTQFNTALSDADFITTTDTATVTNTMLAGSIGNDKLANSSVTINGSAISLGGSTTISAAPTPQAVSSNITLQHNYNYFVDTTAARSLTLPASPSLGDTIAIFDANSSAATNKITVLSNSSKINGTVQDLEIDVNNAAVVLIYTGSSYGWRVG
jgi:hypothetical protein